MLIKTLICKFSSLRFYSGYKLSTKPQDETNLNEDKIKISDEGSKFTPSMHRRLKNTRIEHLNMKLVRNNNSVEPNIYYSNKIKKQNISVDLESPVARNIFDYHQTPAAKNSRKVNNIKIDATHSIFYQSSSKNNSEIIRLASNIQTSAGNRTRFGSNLELGSNKRQGKSFESNSNKKASVVNNLNFDDQANNPTDDVNKFKRSSKTRHGLRVCKVNAPQRSIYIPANNFNEVVFNDEFIAKQRNDFTPKNYKLKRGVSNANNVVVTQRAHHNASVEHKIKRDLLSHIGGSNSNRNKNKYHLVNHFELLNISKR